MTIHEKINDVMNDRRRILEDRARRENFNDTMCRLRQAEEDLNKALCDIFDTYMRKETPTEPIQSKEPFKVKNLDMVWAIYITTGFVLHANSFLYMNRIFVIFRRDVRAVVNC